MTSTTLLDTDTMFDYLLTDAVPSGTAAVQDVHSDSNEEVPFVAWTAANNGQYDHGLWQVTLILTVVADPTEAFSICSHLYREVTGWNIPGEAVLPGIGGVLEVTDAAVFDKVSEGFVHGKHLSQHKASFTISIQEM